MIRNALMADVPAIHRLITCHAEFNRMLERWPVIAYAMVNTLSQRLDATNNASFRDLTEKNHALLGA